MNNDHINPSSDPLEELRSRWRSMKVNTDSLDEANRALSRSLASKKVTSMQQQLAARLRRVAWMGLAFPPLALVMYFDLDLPLWLCVMYVAFGLVMAALNRILGDYVAAENLLELPVYDAIRRATNIKVRQQQLRMMGFVAGAVVIGLFMAEIIDMGNDAAVLGGLIGLLIGLAIGIPRCIRNARLARRLVESLEGD